MRSVTCATNPREPATEQRMTSTSSESVAAALVVFGVLGWLPTESCIRGRSLADRGNCRVDCPSWVSRDADERRGLRHRGAQLIAKAGNGDAEGRQNVLDQRGVQYRYIAGAFDDDDTFRRLGEALAASDSQSGTAGNVLYYLATIPQLFGAVAARLGQAGLAEESEGHFRRIVVEKPFGRDLQSSRQLDAQLHQYFREHQIYRIDHYLAKETVQNILALRFTNTIFEPIWNRRYVDHVQITVAEDLGVEHRGTFYQQPERCATSSRTTSSRCWR